MSTLRLPDRDPAPDSGPDRASGLSTTQVWFGAAERPLFGWLSLPTGARARGGVLLCPPVGEEGRAVHRTWRLLAETLAEQGIAALRFDYDGSGDSAGAQDDPERVQAWLDSISAAQDYLRGLGVTSVSMVGMRLGATLAATRAAAVGDGGAALRSLVLWDPCASGRTFLREGEALLSFSGDAGVDPDPAYRHTPGFQYDHATAKAMRGLDFARLDAARPLAARSLLLTRTDRPVAQSVIDRLEREGERMTQAPALDQDLLLDLAPSDCLVPERSLARVVAWLVEGVAADDLVAVRRPEPEHPVLIASDGVGSTPVRESSRRLGRVGLFGLVDEPVQAPAGAGLRPWVVLVNVAIEHHIGPGRVWVEFARRWAAMGYRCVRIDQSGMGDSPGRAGLADYVVYSPGWIDDMREVLADLGADGSPVYLVGLCSGAYSAIEAAMWDQVAAIFAVNPRLTLWAAGPATPANDPRRRAAQVPIGRLPELARHHRILAGGLWRIYRQLAIWHAPYRVLRRVVRERGTVLHVVANRTDAQHFTEVALWRPSLARLRRDPRFAFEQDEVFDHSLLTRHGQLSTYERATAFLARLHRPVPPR